MTAEVERELIGAAFDDPRITASIKLTEREFYQPAYGAIWEAIRELHTEGTHPTPPLVLEVASRHGRVDSSIIPDVYGAGMVVNAEKYAEKIADGYRRRTIDDALVAGRQELGQNVPTEEVVARITTGIGAATELEQDSEDLLTIDEFVDQELPPEQWVIPGLFAVGERAVVTGEEGSGKSMLLRQIALCAAVGLHPFDYDRFQPARVLVVDAENPKAIMVRKFKGIRDDLRDRGMNAEDRMWVRRFPQGLDLAETRDRLTLHNLCMLTRPNLLVIGPAYKLYVGGANAREEDLARQVTSVLDGLREEFGFALMLEHHSPHENGTTGKRFPRPIGSSLWRRWPEFGFGLTHTDTDRDMQGGHRLVDIKHWRGMREDRPWPTQLESGPRLPWVAANPYELQRGAA